MRHRFYSNAMLAVFLGLIDPTNYCLTTASAEPTVARKWNEALLSAIRLDTPAPTVHARNLYHKSAAIFDAWAAYDDVATGHFYTTKHTASDVHAAREQAMSYAAYRVLSARYQLARDPVASQEILDNLMDSLGYDPGFTSTVGDSPAAIGNRIAQQILTDKMNDGANEAGSYADNTGYAAVNTPMIVDYPSVTKRFVRSISRSESPAAAVHRIAHQSGRLPRTIQSAGVYRPALGIR